jgi:hypothetical protein
MNNTTATKWKTAKPSIVAHEVYDRQIKTVTRVGRKKELLAWWATLPSMEMRQRYEVRPVTDTRW